MPKTTDSRRQAIPWTLPVAFLLALARPTVAEEQQWRFTVHLNNAEIGHGSYKFSGESDRLLVTSEVRFNVRWLFFNAYTYAHSSREVYQGNCLQSIDATTNDNGDTYGVHGKIANRQFVVATKGNQYTLPACLITFAYWNPTILEQTRLLNAQTGELTDVAIESMGSEPIQISQQQLMARRYELLTNDKAMTLWYSDDGRWLGLSSKLGHERTLRYQLESVPGRISKVKVD